VEGDDPGHLGLIISFKLALVDEVLTKSFSGSFCILQSIFISASATHPLAMTYIKGDMLILILHQESNELLEQGDRLYRFLLGPYMPAY